MAFSFSVTLDESERMITTEAQNGRSRLEIALPPPVTSNSEPQG